MTQAVALEGAGIFLAYASCHGRLRTLRPVNIAAGLERVLVYCSRNAE
jgi:hypothetical protein